MFEADPPKDGVKEKSPAKEAGVVLQPPQATDLDKINQVFIYFIILFKFIG